MSCSFLFRLSMRMGVGKNKSVATARPGMPIAASAERKLTGTVAFNVILAVVAAVADVERVIWF